MVIVNQIAAGSYRGKSGYFDSKLAETHPQLAYCCILAVPRARPFAYRNPRA